MATASDVYSLGVLLYRLLTGHRPYAMESRSIEELWDHIRNRPPRRPSTVIHTSEGGYHAGIRRLRAQHRADRLERQLAGDLDNILMMALRKEPERRYGSVEQFANDLRRHLQGHPVTARPDTLRYRTGKFIYRHRTGVVAAALIVITLMAGISPRPGNGTWRIVSAPRRETLPGRTRAGQSVLFELHDAIAPLPGSTHAREFWSNAPSDIWTIWPRESSGDDCLQRERAMAYERIGDVLGLPSQPNLGQSAESLASYRKALEIEKGLVRADDSNEGRCGAIWRGCTIASAV